MINGLKFGLPAQGKEYHKIRLNGINVGYYMNSIVIDQLNSAFRVDNRQNYVVHSVGLINNH